MKRLIFTTIFLCTLFAAQAQGESADEIIALYGLHGNIKEIKEDGISDYIYEFDKEGHLIKRTSFLHGDESSFKTIETIKNGVITERAHSSRSYNEKSFKKYSITKYTYTFDEHGNWITRTAYFENGRIFTDSCEYTYHNNGKIKERVFDKRFGGCKHTYNEEGFLIEEKRHFLDLGDKGHFKETYIFNADGLLSKQQHNGRQDVCTEYQYTFDEKGNWTKRKVRYSDNKQFRTEIKRQITYYE